MTDIDFLEYIKESIVKHSKYGIGRIIEVLDERIFVKFDIENRNVTFQYPLAFHQGYLTFVDSAIATDFKKIYKENKNNQQQEGYNNFKQSIIKTMLNKNLAYRVFFDHIDNQQYFDLLKNDVSEIIRSSKRNPELASKENKAIVTGFLAMLSFKKYDGKIWEHVRNELDSLFRYSNNTQALDKVVRELVSDKTVLIDSNQMMNPLVHAAVPLYYLNKMLYFIYDIFVLNFDKELDGAPVEKIVDMTLQGIINIYLLRYIEEDTLNFTVTKKTYTLIKSTKLAIIYYKEDMNYFITRMLYLINDWYYGQNPRYEYPREIIDVFNEWVSENKSIERETKTHKEYITKPIYILNIENKKIFLKTPVIPMADTDEYKREDIQIIVHNGENKELVYNEDYRLIEKIGYSSIEFKDIEIFRPMEKIRIDVITTKKVLYTTGEALYREYIIFDENGKEIANNTEYNGVVYIVHNSDLKTKGKILDFSGYKVLVQVVKNGDSFQLGHHTICFSEMMKPGLYGEEVNGLIAFIGERYVKVYKNISIFVFESDFDIKDIVFLVNNVKIDITDKTIEVIKRGVYFNYRINLSKLNISPGIKRIKVLSKHNIINSREFILDYDIDYYFENIEGKIVSHFKTALEKTLKIDSDLNFDENAVITARGTLGFDEIKYQMIIDPFRYRWENEIIWHKQEETENQHNNLYIASQIEKCEILTREKEVISNLNFENFNFITKINTSALSDKHKLHEFVYLRVHFNQDKTMMIKVYLRQTVTGYKYFLEKNTLQLDFDIKCFKSKSIKLYISDLYGNDHFRLIDDPSVKINEIEPFVKYKIQLEQVANIFTGTEKCMLYESEIFISDFNNLKDKKFSVKKATYWEGDIEILSKINQQEIIFLDKIDSENTNYEIKNEIFYEVQTGWNKKKNIAKIINGKNLEIEIRINYTEVQEIGFNRINKQLENEDFYYFDIDYSEELELDENDYRKNVEVLSRISTGNKSTTQKSKALFMLGKYYILGLGIEKNRTKAYEKWEEAINLDSIDAIMALATNYYSGSGIDFNRLHDYKKKAIYLYEIASAKGHPQAIKRMNELNNKILVTFHANPREDLIK